MPEPPHKEQGTACAPPRPSQEIERKLERLSQLMRRLIRTMRLPDDPIDLTPTQLLVLVHLDEQEKLRIGMLAQALGAAQNTVSEVVSRMQRVGMVCKERDPADSRAVVVWMTPKGRAALQSRRETAQRAHRMLLEALGSLDQQRFIDAFELLVAMAERARAGMPRIVQASRRKK